MRVHGISFLIVIILSKINANGQTLAVSVLSLLNNGNEKICKSAQLDKLSSLPFVLNLTFNNMSVLSVE
jgi:hypothetical protein